MLSSLQQPPEGACEHLSQVPTHLCSHVPLGKSTRPPRGSHGPCETYRHPLLSIPSYLLATSPNSLCFNHKGLLPVLPTHQAMPCPRAIARSMPAGWNALPPPPRSLHGCFFLVIQGLDHTSPPQEALSELPTKLTSPSI